MITIENVSKSYGNKKSLQDVSLTIETGEIYGLLGANGAGKSTLLSILATISRASSGTITMNGLELSKNMKHVREMIGYVPQDIALWEQETVKENLVLWSKFARDKVTEKQLYDLCGMVQLQEKWHEKVSSLSGGMKRKLNIAVALIHNPDILLMDEPTVGIDIQSKFEINQSIRDLASRGKTVVYTTHDMSEILFLCDKIGILQEGNLQFSGTLEDARNSAIAQGVSPQSDEELLYYLFGNQGDGSCGLLKK
ncbi:ABC transporter ATP-binding protein [Ferdinandcohnia quinoae]|uniref:ABC transporter ATP-binding protein n=1 Tax=Fredinandcohnia quinoae TaxID=2918902 RepID=A0AAW5E4H3_9BACI|nr:ABC transporter ATP-binding protein [Fredinandcohnia sp. SECRCQ15]